jgi:hypothetical protein
VIGQPARGRPVVSFRVRSCQGEEATNDSFEVPNHGGNSAERDNKDHLSLMEGQTWCGMREGGESIPELFYNLRTLTICAWPETRRLERLEGTQRVNVHRGGVEEAVRQVETRPVSSQVQDNGNLGCHFIH